MRRTAPPESPAAHDRRAAGGGALHRRLHVGAVTEVWSGRTPAGADCVFKRPRPRWAAHAGAVRLVEREWEFLRHAAGPGVVATFGLQPIGEAPALSLEYLPGGDLVPLAGSHPRHWAGAACGVARALRRAHGRGIVHRDVKPRNVLLDAAGGARLIDFALAARVGEATPAGGGTPAYQRAAVRHGAPAQPADDVHAFAVMIYELWAGELPFGADPAVADLRRFPRPLRADRAATAREPAVAALMDHALEVLACVPEEPAQALGVFLEALQAIIAD